MRVVEQAVCYSIVHVLCAVFVVDCIVYGSVIPIHLVPARYSTVQYSTYGNSCVFRTGFFRTIQSLRLVCLLVYCISHDSQRAPPFTSLFWSRLLFLHKVDILLVGCQYRSWYQPILRHDVRISCNNPKVVGKNPNSNDHQHQPHPQHPSIPAGLG